MTPEQIKEAIAAMFENYRLGKDGNTSTEAAAAVMALVGPKPLHWLRSGNHWADDHGYLVRKMGSRYTLTIRNQFNQYFNTLEAAQAAAQSHADAAHWANTKIGGE